ncbi:hypothetical protein [Ancylobacter sp. TS-1]|uniref:hypothetical protein n=1 Tax=Ancylobacter sp. TS-1 TaxID=1850374 RepID=UPI00192E7239|nr:hypothetical protein [Ancylobacter sp. TS-1]
MAGNIDKRLTSLKARRSGTDRLSRVAKADQTFIALAASQLSESYQKRAPTQPYTRYALGAMQEVGPEYTRISLETADRVKNQLYNSFQLLNRSVDFRLQGSVPCNIHIRGVSDVDLLILDDAFFTYDILGPSARSGYYNSPVPYTPISALGSLRAHIEKILPEKFPAAEVDISGGKAVKISGGSLARPVDVVPSHWHNTSDYQSSKMEVDRAIRILDKKYQVTIDNMPFRHIKRITDRDTMTALSLKKAIRLCKHVKSDAEDEGTAVSLPSFDIAATMYHANLSNLRAGAGYELGILAETQRHLDELARNSDLAQSLIVPDGSRRIFDTSAKLQGLLALSLEMDDLAKEVSREQNSPLRTILGRELSFSEMRAALNDIYIPVL